MWYGQLVIGPPGSGKSSYCFGMQQMLDALGRRHIVVNLDPMNDLLPYKCDIDVMDLVKGEDVMNAHSLGPNGAMIYCMEYLLENVDWLVDKLKAFTNSYVLIDCPGQVELFTHHDALRAIIRHLERLDFRMTAVQVVDSTLCTDAFKHISALLMSLNAQLQLELPHINVLSKVDLLRLHRKDLRFRLEFYADAYDVSALLQAMEDDPHPLGQKLLGFSRAVCELVEDFNLVSFLPVCVTDKECMLLVLRAADAANGFAMGNYATNERGYPLQLDTEEERQQIMERLQEKYVDFDPEKDEAPIEEATEAE
ncbi:GPN-loop GTPase QQT1 [Cyclospora cayetanensis]|uniref:GPN-loop GTPase 2 n=1 Tax=Cyclospora cayetanensis TaxID=88456 RepID=A0A6P6RW35_9EIME|nr:GPN-loop GTPase QQT1 [Cyclospora cayetanensis]